MVVLALIISLKMANGDLSENRDCLWNTKSAIGNNAIKSSPHSKSHPVDQNQRSAMDGQGSYAKSYITNDLDFEIKEDLDEIDDLLDRYPKKAHNLYKRLFKKFKSPRALFGMAKALNKIAVAKIEASETRDRRGQELLRGEALVLQGRAAEHFCAVLSLEAVPIFLQMTSGRTCVEFRKERHEYELLIDALEKMTTRFPKVKDYPSELAFQYLLQGRFSEAASLYYDLVTKWPHATKEKSLFGLALTLLNSPQFSDEEITSYLISGAGLEDMAKVPKHLF